MMGEARDKDQYFLSDATVHLDYIIHLQHKRMHI